MTLHAGVGRRRIPADRLEPAGAVVIVTATARLSRDLSSRYDIEQLAAGRVGWTSPPILPFDAWIARLWEFGLYSGGVSDAHRLLQPVEEHALWEQIVRTSPEGSELLETARTAEVALAAWTLACRWELPLDAPEWNDTEDTEAFRSWALEFEARCRREAWLPRAKLAGQVNASILAGAIPVPEELVVAGFDELPPVFERLLTSLRACGVVVDVRDSWWGGLPTAGSRGQVRVAFPDITSEISAAASWARRILDDAAGASPPDIGIVVPQLQKYRDRIERVFRAEFNPGDSLLPSRDHSRAFNISLGPPLSDYPIVEAALALLRMHPDSVSLEDAVRFLRSPFLGGAAAESTRRGLLAEAVGRLREPRVSCRAILDLAEDSSRAYHCPALAKLLRGWCRAKQDVPSARPPSDWPAVFALLLTSLGWPGDRTLSSAEYQTLDAWSEALNELAGLDAVIAEVELSVALGAVRRIARSRQFQPESDPAPVQILGLLEAGGFQFQRLWIMGMDADAWPPSPRSNPFLPLNLQRRHDMPDSSPERHLESAERLTRRLLSSVAGESRPAGSPTCVVSYSLGESEGGLRPSPLFEDLPDVDSTTLELAGSVSFAEKIRLSSRLETVSDQGPPPWRDRREGVVPGGTRVFADQAACPFRAFARSRLGAGDWAAPPMDLDALDRGVLVHKVMEALWGELGSLDELMSLDRERLDAIVSTVVHRAVARMAARRSILRNSGFASAERKRLETLVMRWLEVERQRATFRVVERETRAFIEIAGLKFEVRADRVDELEDGSRVLIDYKTQLASPRAWAGDRPEEPQLPVYAARMQASGDDVAGVFFAVLRKGKETFRGVARSRDIVPGVAPEPDEPALSVTVAAWQHVLDRLGQEFRDGHAKVDPRDGPTTCRRCNLGALCRVQDTDRKAGQEPADSQE